MLLDCVSLIVVVSLIMHTYVPVRLSERYPPMEEESSELTEEKTEDEDGFR